VKHRREGSLLPFLLILFLPWWVCLLLGFALPFLFVYSLPFLLVAGAIRRGYLGLRNWQASRILKS